MSKKIKTCISITIVLLLWHYFSTKYSSYLLPSPVYVFSTMLDYFKNGLLLKHILSSLYRVVLGFFISFCLAFMVAILQLFFKKIMDYFDWIIQFLRVVPPLSLIPLLILWFGIGEVSKILIIILASFFPMYLNILKGFNGVDSKLLEVGRSFKFDRLKLFYKVILPASLPDILIGLRIGLGYSYRAIIGAEMIAASSGLGYLINFAKSMTQTEVVIMGIFWIGFLGYLCDYLFKLLLRLWLKERTDYDWN